MRASTRSSGTDSPAYGATETYRERFGDDPIIVLVRGPLTKLLLTQDLERLLGLEGCIAGNAPAGVTPPGGANGPCGRLAATKPVKVVFGPGTFVAEAVRQLGGGFARRVAENSRRAVAAAATERRAALRRGSGPAAAQRAGAAARARVNADFEREVVDLALRYGLTAVPRLDDPNFVSTLVFDATKPAGTPKRRFAYLFASRRGGPGSVAIVQVRLKAGLTERQRAAALKLVRAAVAMREWQPRNGAAYTVTGAPVVVSDLTSSITKSMWVLLVAVLLVMALTLMLVFGGRPRLLPLAIALAAAAMTFGVVSLLGASLTMASIAVLPVLVGLAVDYAIQLQARAQEEQGDSVPRPPPGGRRCSAPRRWPWRRPRRPRASRRSRCRRCRWFATSGCCSSPASRSPSRARCWPVRPRSCSPSGPRCRRRCAAAARARRARWARCARGRRPVRSRAACAAPAAPRWRGRSPNPGACSPSHSCSPPGAGRSTRRRGSSPTSRSSSRRTSARCATSMRCSARPASEASSTSSSRAATSTDPAVLNWMIGYQTKVLERFGYTPERGCGTAELCPAFSLPDLFTTPASRRDADQIRGLLDAVPPYFSQSVVSPDRRTATLAFGIRLMALDRQKEVIDEMRAALAAGRPPGVRAQLAGLPVLAADANAEIASSTRRMLTLLAGLLAVAIVLLVALRGVARALVPLVPIVLATGWSALVLFALRVPLNPMSVTLGALVIAISTEFSVLLSERYRQERALGHDPHAALQRTYRSTGAAVLASGATAIAGFAVLVVSDIRMLRDFGFVTVIDLTVSLLGVLLVLPAVLLLAERRGRPRQATPRPAPSPPEPAAATEAVA